MFLFPDRSTYVRMDHVMGSFLFLFLFFSVYCNSLLGTLNVREAIRQRGHNDLAISLRPIDYSNPSTSDNHKVDGSVCLLVLYRRSSDCSLRKLTSGSRSKPTDLSQDSKPVAVMTVPHSSNPPHKTTTPEWLRLSPSSSREDPNI